ncbi:MAG: leucine dehydrogenase [Patescibacteria group bacterium]|nr:leucine dehydrogenase [Patescibacteria group bacterium]
MLKGFIAIHRKFPNIPSFGATRMAHYRTDQEMLDDALKLSRLMSYKNAMAGLPYGGAKAVIMLPSRVTLAQKKNILRAYSEKVNELAGSFITGADVGIDDYDLKVMYEKSKYMVGLKSKPVPYTALGIYYALRVGLREIFGSDSVSERTFAIQGLGKIGSNLLKLIYKEAGKIYAADTNPDTRKNIKKTYPKVNLVPPEKIFSLQVDVFSPCALSGAINKSNVNKLQCKIVAGGANNQLESPEMGRRLFENKILYAPDYVINAGGLISVADEYENRRINNERLLGKLQVIARNFRAIISTSNNKHLPTNLVADQMSEKILNRKYEPQITAVRI